MQPELIERIRSRDRRLGFMVLAIVALLVSGAAASVYAWLHNAQHVEEIVVGYVLSGMITGGIFLVATWTTLSMDRLIRRMRLLLLAMAALAACWLLGYVSVEADAIPMQLSDRDPVQAWGMAPFLFTSLCLPLVVYRLFTSRVLADRYLPAPISGNVTITHFLTVTAWVALVVAGLQLASFIFQTPQLAVQFLGLLLVVGCSVSVAFILPAANLLFSPRFNPLLPMACVITLAIGLAWLVGRLNFQVPAFAGIAFAGPGALIYGLGALGIRMCGYRMTKTVDSTATSEGNA